MAVILGTELQHLFNCDADRPACTEATIAEGLDRLEAMGVNYVFPIHHKLNQFGGAAQFNLLTNGPTADCYETQEACAAEGLTPLGRFLVEELTARGMFIDTEHLSWKAFDDTLAIAEARSYPVLASHIGPFDLKADTSQTEQVRRTDQIQRILDVGGMLGIILGVGVEEYARSATRRRRCPSPAAAPTAGPTPTSTCGTSPAAGCARRRRAHHLRVGLERLCQLARPPASAPLPVSRAPPPTAGRSPSRRPSAYPLALPAQAGARRRGRPPPPAALRAVSPLGLQRPRPAARRPGPGVRGGPAPDLGLTLADLEPLYRSARGVVDLWQAARARQVPGDRHHLRWVPARAFDLLDLDPLPTASTAAARVEAAPGFPLCRLRQGQLLGFERDGACQLVEAGAAPGLGGDVAAGRPSPPTTPAAASTSTGPACATAPACSSGRATAAPTSAGACAAGPAPWAAGQRRQRPLPRSGGAATGLAA